LNPAREDKRYDVAVIGAGVIGLACGWRAARAGLSVVVIDRASPGAGASGVAAGMLAPVTEATFGEDRSLRLNLESAARWPAFAAELEERAEVDVAFRRSGTLLVAVDRDDVEELHRLYAFQRSLDLEAEWLTRSQCRELEPGLAPRVGEGILAPHDHSIDPRALLRALAVALDRDGGELVIGLDAAVAWSPGGLPCGVQTEAGLFAAAEVVVAAGCWSGAVPGVEGHDPPPIRPVKGQLVRLRGGPAPLAERAVRTPRCYVVPRTSGEVVVGATVEERGFDTAVTAGAVHRLLDAAWEVLPEVAELELVETAAGLRPSTPDNAPVIGRGTDGLIWATGHYRNGVLLAPLTADVIANLLTGKHDQVLELADVERFPPMAAAPGANA
jgi:glycine oxidase